MKEKETQSAFTIVWPQGSVVEVGSSVDFVYIMRKDGVFAMSPIAQKMASEYHVDEEQLTSVLLEEYDTFFAKLADTFHVGYASKGNFELHLYDPETLDTAVKSKAGSTSIISLDPLMKKGVQQFGVSRGYFLGGTKDFGQVARPGNDTLFNQAKAISSTLHGHPVVVSEDDIFSGGSVIASLNALLASGVTIEKVIPGIQIGEPKKLEDMGIGVDPVIKYKTTDEVDIFSKLDLGDPRDYLLGASGLVIQLPDGELGRAPYILPFVSPAARAGIPEGIEKEFSMHVLQANLEFFKKIQEKTGAPILLKHMDSQFQVYMYDMYGVDVHTTMSQIAMWLMDNMDTLWEMTQKQGEFQEKLASLHLPKKMIFLDVNGTLFSDESVDGYIALGDIAMLKEKMAKVKENGFIIGLCSDSPFPQLAYLAETLGIDGPILAENGNILWFEGKSVVLHALPEIDAYKEQVMLVADMHGFQKIDDCIAPEFGGTAPMTQSGQWSFGAGRETSVTVFAPAELIKKLGVSFGGDQTSYSIDCSPEYGFFALHPGENYKKNKGKALDLLVAYGHAIVMVGNSMSDWVDPEHGVVCAFVGGARIQPHVVNKAAYISDKPVIQGVIDILEHIV